MWKRGLVVVTVLVCIAANSQSVFAQSGTTHAAPKKDPRELIIRIKNTSVEELRKMPFLELNFLKNAVFAARGYKFADDRPWLNEFFCGTLGRRVEKSTIQSLEGVLTSWASKLRNETPWNLDEYQFPACKDSGPITEDQKRAIANIKVALYKKIDAYGNIAAIDLALGKELKELHTNAGWAWMLGKPINATVLQTLGEVSIRRDIHGLYRMLQLTKKLDDFDAMELLGLFAGDIIFLHNVIEAQHGKMYTGVVGWEIAQLVGVTEKKQDYDSSRLPQEVRDKLLLLDEILQKIVRSGLNDIPESLRNRAIQFDEPYDLEAC